MNNLKKLILEKHIVTKINKETYNELKEMGYEDPDFDLNLLNKPSVFSGHELSFGYEWLTKHIIDKNRYLIIGTDLSGGVIIKDTKRKELTTIHLDDLDWDNLARWFDINKRVSLEKEYKKYQKDFKKKHKLAGIIKDTPIINEEAKISNIKLIDGEEPELIAMYSSWPGNKQEEEFFKSFYVLGDIYIGEGLVDYPLIKEKKTGHIYYLDLDSLNFDRSSITKVGNSINELKKYVDKIR